MSSPPDPQPEPREASASPLIWGEDGAPRSRLFDDVYFSKADGLAETRTVFLQGCGLPEAWAGRTRFVAGELGFGTGLNILALLHLWRSTREPDARLHVFSIEAYPLAADEAARALAAWPELADLAGLMLAAWPRRARGFHRMQLPALGATLDLAVMDAAEALAAWGGRADAWFLDGFAPARNPLMWSDAVLAAVAEHSAPGARAATFTVAGAVRRGLAAQGFAVEKRPGFGHKRERLEARAPGEPASSTPAPATVAVVGAGVAGAALARALAAEGLTCLVIEAVAGGGGASGNPAALVMPRLDAGGGRVAQLYAQAFHRAVDLYGQTAAVIARGVLQLAAEPRDEGRFERVAASGLFAPDVLARLDAAGAAEQLGEPVKAAALAFAEGLVIEPAAVLEAWLGGADRRIARVARLEPDAGGWRLLGASGEEIARAGVVCIAAGVESASLVSSAPLAPVRGQVSLVRSAQAAVRAAIGAGYIAPTRDGLLFGATHDRGQVGCEVTAADHARNLDLLGRLRPALAATLRDQPLDGRASLRAATPDYLPLAGAVEGAEGLYILSGLGSRGFCTAPLLAEHVAALIAGAPSPLPV
ncbi:MAG: FAD-dependent 5-carboxymethylaminomethyl-2-thiouridine(34) oxidoreductase MnmC, partial [Caulobacteraceae bacterium]|nr:FAD-dependent 5-carboxymethylaminomethyl-2-thiouridine(34) oxidoreductase MnmC [Caulobacteraceae bacterium]